MSLAAATDGQQDRGEGSHAAWDERGWLITQWEASSPQHESCLRQCALAI